MPQPPRQPSAKDDPHYAPESGDKPEADEAGGVREQPRDGAAPDDRGRGGMGRDAEQGGTRDKLDGTR